MSNQFQPLADGEVVSIKNTYRVSELAAEIRSKVAASLAEWSQEQGVDGEALRFGSAGWEQGKVRLRLSIEFCPNDEAASEKSTSSNDNTAPNTTADANVANFGAGGSQMSSAPLAAVATAAPIALQNPPIIESTIEAEPEMEMEHEHFDLGTMSEVTGEINMHLNDGDPNSYMDFDLSDSLPEISLDDLVAQAEGPRPSIIDEVWNEMSQPHWPGVSRA